MDVRREHKVRTMLKWGTWLLYAWPLAFLMAMVIGYVFGGIESTDLIIGILMAGANIINVGLVSGWEEELRNLQYERLTE